MFSSSTKGDLVPIIPHGPSAEMDGTSESRIDAAIRAAMAVDAQRGANGFNANGFNRFSLTPDISSNSSAFQNPSGNNNPNMVAVGAPLPPRTDGAVNGGTVTTNRDVHRKAYPGGSTQQHQQHDQVSRVGPIDESTSGSGSVDQAGVGHGGGNPNTSNMFVYTKDDRQDERTGGDSGIASSYVSNRAGSGGSGDRGGATSGAGNGVTGNGRSAIAERQRTTWERGGGVDTARAVSLQFNTATGAMDTSGGKPAVADRRVGAGRDPQTVVEAGGMEGEGDRKVDKRPQEWVSSATKATAILACALRSWVTVIWGVLACSCM